MMFTEIVIAVSDNERLLLTLGRLLLLLHVSYIFKLNFVPRQAVCELKHRKWENILLVSSCVRQVFSSFLFSRIEDDTSVQLRPINSALSLVDKSHKLQKKRKIIMQLCYDVFPCTSIALASLAHRIGTENNLSTTKSPKTVWSRKHTREFNDVEELERQNTWRNDAQTSERARDGKHFSTFLSSRFLGLCGLRAPHKTFRF